MRYTQYVDKSTKNQQRNSIIKFYSLFTNPKLFLELKVLFTEDKNGHQYLKLTCAVILGRLRPTRTSSHEMGVSQMSLVRRLLIRV